MFNDIAIFTLTSKLHDENAVQRQTVGFLEELGLDHALIGSDFSTYGTHTLDIIYVRTGGTEGLFKKLLPQLRSQSEKPFYLLSSGSSNSLAASMEILSFLRQNGIAGEILHGGQSAIIDRVTTLAKVSAAQKSIHGCRLGVIGQPSDWLIASHTDAGIVKNRLGVELVDIPMEELTKAIASTPSSIPHYQAPTSAIKNALPGAMQICDGLRKVIKEYDLQGFTLRCFDLLSKIHNTGCLALAILNSEGYVAGCEGDVPTMISMFIAKHLIGVSGFQANPSSIDLETKRMILAHCTIPFNMVESYRLDTHFESGIGVGIHGEMPLGKVTIFKVSGTLDRFFLAEGQLVGNKFLPSLCRTQVDVKLSTEQIHYFLTNPIGNHHVVLPGHQKALFEEFLKIM
ncbi:MAG: hypothetical protein J5529_01750 [Prevotella sp.]|nr:hypothetical protein [Prevotella sp.]